MKKIIQVFAIASLALTSSLAGSKTDYIHKIVAYNSTHTSKADRFRVSFEDGTTKYIMPDASQANLVSTALTAYSAHLKVKVGWVDGSSDYKVQTITIAKDL